MMAKYRKKPVVVEAEQWRGIYERGELVVPDPPAGVMWKRRWWWPFKAVPVVRTLEGDMRVNPPRLVNSFGLKTWPLNEVGHGDYIITGVQGERYPCKPDIFEQTYEKVES